MTEKIEDFSSFTVNSIEQVHKILDIQGLVHFPFELDNGKWLLVCPWTGWNSYAIRKDDPTKCDLITKKDKKSHVIVAKDADSMLEDIINFYELSCK